MAGGVGIDLFNLTLIKPDVIAALIYGFSLGFGLLFAIGAQNAFVLRHGLARTHVFVIALFCAVSDALLIILGIAGVSLGVSRFVGQYGHFLFGGAALWLACYGLLRLRDAIKGQSATIADGQGRAVGLAPTLSVLAVLTFGNPHVYLDTVVLIGTVSLPYSGAAKFAYASGAVCASFVFFFGLAYGAKMLAPQMRRPGAWRILDLFIAMVMFALALAMARSGGWL